MSDPPFIYFIHSKLPRRDEMPAVIGPKFLDTLDALSGIDPLFTNWNVLDLPAMATLPLAVARPRISAIIENNVVRNDYDQPEPQSGYKAIGVTDNPTQSRVAKLRVAAGAVFPGELGLEVGDFIYPTDPLIVSYSLFRKALLATSAIWQPTWASVDAFRTRYWEKPIVPGAPEFPYSPFHIPWIAYLSPALSVRFALPADILTERTPDGGLLMTATKERLDPTNLEHLRRAHILADTMIARTGYKSDRRMAR
jgi:hypothetical protein